MRFVIYTEINSMKINVIIEYNLAVLSLQKIEQKLERYLAIWGSK